MKVVAILCMVSLLCLLLIGCGSAPEDVSLITIKTSKAPNQTDIVWIANHLCDKLYYPIVAVYDEPTYVRVKCSNPIETIVIDYVYDTQELKIVTQ